MILIPSVNVQPIEKKNYRDDFKVEVHSIFPTIQGEGPFTGHRAVFVRLTGCNLQCPGCDTEYTSVRTAMSPEEIHERINAAMPGCKLIVITGGEPFRQDISPLCRKLIAHGHTVQVETNGTLPPPPSFPQEVVVVCSPKTGSVHPLTGKAAYAYKYVLHADSIDAEDGLPIQALGHSCKPRLARPPGLFNPQYIYLQPMDCQDERQNWQNVQACVDSCMKYGYVLQLQVHKLIDRE